MGTKNNPGKFDCYANAEPDEPMFVLLGRDASAPETVRTWAARRELMIDVGRKPESDRPMVEEAQRLADDMEIYRDRRRDVAILPEPGLPDIVERIRQGVANAAALGLENLGTIATLKEAAREFTRLRALLDTPHTSDWFDGVRREAGHQIGRWGSDHDQGKTAFDWFWLIGYLSQKAADAQVRGDAEKAKHHTVSTGAAMLNWFRSLTGDNTTMRPGIEKPTT